mmetsp:Transcript_8707/g.23510  ORF Transcript_8707/g.23510 Transcript_8707/m.23510 type:complete len:228 (+) Transcript_8707:957-1640(+)
MWHRNNNSSLRPMRCRMTKHSSMRSNNNSSRLRLQCNSSICLRQRTFLRWSWMYLISQPSQKKAKTTSNQACSNKTILATMLLLLLRSPLRVPANRLHLWHPQKAWPRGRFPHPPILNHEIHQLSLLRANAHHRIPLQCELGCPHSPGSCTISRGPIAQRQSFPAKPPRSARWLGQTCSTLIWRRHQIPKPEGELAISLSPLFDESFRKWLQDGAARSCCILRPAYF